MNSKPHTSVQPVIIVPYRKSWKWKYRIEAFRLWCSIGKVTTHIRHIGSTSVPGLAAKPIVDILIGIRNLQDTPFLVRRLSRLGYHYYQEYEEGLPERRYFDRRGYHLHIVETDSYFFRRHVAFRDYLRSHPETAAEYAALKIKLAGQFSTDREGYTNAKTEFIQSVERKAM
jgi:GrpB-like predicted nucleotidyltransferase (UPF0157 family)